MHTHGLGRAHQRTQILGILKMVQNEQQRRFIHLVGSIQQVIDGGVRVVVDLQRHALSAHTLAHQLVEKPPFDAAHRHIALLGQCLNVSQNTARLRWALPFEP